jgi:uncharacterized protein YbcI
MGPGAVVGRHLREASPLIYAGALPLRVPVFRVCRRKLLSRPTRGTIEAEAANAVVRFQREQQGRGPADVRAHLVGDLLLVRCTGIFTQTEARLAVTEEGRKLIKSARQELRSINHAEIEAIVAGIVGCGVVRSYYDIDVEAAEQVEVYVLEMDIEKRLLR